MRIIEKTKRERDLAFESWRKELRRLFELEKSQRERAQQAAVELQRQKTMVSQARASYDRANDEYLNRVQHSRTPPHSHDSVHRPRA